MSYNSKYSGEELDNILTMGVNNIPNNIIINASGNYNNIDEIPFFDKNGNSCPLTSSGIINNFHVGIYRVLANDLENKLCSFLLIQNKEISSPSDENPFNITKLAQTLIGLQGNIYMRSYNSQNETSSNWVKVVLGDINTVISNTTNHFSNDEKHFSGNEKNVLNTKIDELQEQVNAREMTRNKSNTIDDSADDTKYPTTKAVKDYVADGLNNKAYIENGIIDVKYTTENNVGFAENSRKIQFYDAFGNEVDIADSGAYNQLHSGMYRISLSSAYPEYDDATHVVFMMQKVRTFNHIIPDGNSSFEIYQEITDSIGNVYFRNVRVMNDGSYDDDLSWADKDLYVESTNYKVSDISEVTDYEEDYYPNVKAVKDFVDDNIMQINVTLSNMENNTNKAVYMDANNPDTISQELYPSTEATVNFVKDYVGNNMRNLSEDISEVYVTLSEKEGKTNKSTVIDDSADDIKYPTTKAVVDYVENEVDNVVLDRLMPIFEVSEGHNLLNPDNFESGYYETTLEKKASTNHMRTITPIPISEDISRLYIYENIPSNINVGTSLIYLMFLDSDGNYKTGLSKSFELFTDVGIPAGTASLHVYISGVDLGIDVSQICVSGAELDGFEPYSSGLLIKTIKPEMVANKEENVNKVSEIKDGNIDEEHYPSTGAVANYVNNKIVPVEEVVVSDNKFDGVFDAEGYYIDVDKNNATFNELIKNSSFKCTERYICISDKPVMTLYMHFTKAPVSKNMCFVFYDENKNYVTHRVFTTNMNASQIFTIHSTSEAIKYFRLYVENAYDGQIFISPYNPYRIDFVNFDYRIEVKQVGFLKEKVIVNFGDSIFGNYDYPNDISTEIAKITDATVHNCGFGGCRMAKHTIANFDAFSMKSLVSAIVSNDFSIQDAAIESGKTAATEGAGKLPSYFEDTLALLKSIDFTDVDIITIAYGTNDFTGNIVIDDEANLYNTDCFAGALRYSIETLLNTYPHLKIFICSQIYRFWIDTSNDNAFIDDSDTHTRNDGKMLTDFVEKTKEVAVEYHLPYIDNYYSLGMNKFNRSIYFSKTDGTHPLLTGRRLIAEHIAINLVDSKNDVASIYEFKKNKSPVIDDTANDTKYPTTKAVKDYVDTSAELNTIVNTTEGSLVNITDSANAKLKGLKIYGKTTQAAEPTIENPQPLVNVGDGGSITTDIYGGNLFNISLYDAFIVQSDGSYSNKEKTSASKTCPLNLPYGSYTIAYDLKCPVEKNARIRINLKDGTHVETFEKSTGDFIRFGESFVGEPISWNIYFSAACEAGTLFIKNAQLEVGNVTTKPKPYKEPQTFTLNTPNGLAGAPVSSGGNYTDENGQQWICDIADIAKSKYIENIYKIVNTGEEISIDSTFYKNGIVYFQIAHDMPCVKYLSVSNCFENTTNWSLLTTTPYKLFADNKFIYLSVNASDVGITGTETQAVMKNLINAWITTKFSADKPLQIYCGLSEPIEKDLNLTEEEIAQYKALTTYKPVTNVFNDADAHMKVDYIADPKTYIDNKFSELQAAILNVAN